MSLRSLRQLALRLGLFVSLSSLLPAEPIPPVGLRQLFTEAEQVLIGEVVNIELERPDKGWSPSLAQMRVASVLKGPPVGEEVRIRFHPRMGCPADASFESGRRYLVFLKPTESAGLFSVPHLSYGAKPLEAEREQGYRAQLDALPSLTSLPPGQEQRRAFASWLVRGAVNPATRSTSLIELDPWEYWNFNRWVDLPGQDPDEVTFDPAKYGPRPWRDLTLAEVDQLVRALRDIRLEGWSLGGAGDLMRIVAKRLQHPPLLRWAKRFAKVEDELVAKLNYSEPTEGSAKEPRKALQQFLRAYEQRPR